jgi:Flp pilus assembly protein TadB
MKHLITLFTLTLFLSSLAFAGPGKKLHQQDSKLKHEQAVPGLSLEDDAVLIRTSPIVEEKALEETALNTEMTPSELSNTEIRVSERTQKRLDKVDRFLKKRMEKLEKKPNRSLWNSRGTQWIIIGLILMLVALIFTVIGIILLPLLYVAYLFWTVGVILVIVGLIVGLMG